MRKHQTLSSRIITLCLAVCCILSLSACTGTEKPNPTTDPGSSVSTNPSTTDGENNPSAPSNNPTSTTQCSHTASEWITDKTATCTAEGAKHKACTKCNSVLESATISKADHNFNDYKCVTCGVLQEGYLSDFLIAWVQKNGTANGETISVDVASDTILYGLTYNTSGKYFFFSLLDSEYDDFLSIKFTNQKDTYEIAYLQGKRPNSREIYGTVSAPSFTENTPISVDTYHGPADQRPNAAENARICTVLMLDFLEQFFAENSVGITLKDLGFTAY